MSLADPTLAPTWLTPHTKMWRYVRLSTLLQLLQNRVYIPSIQELKRGDPTELTFGSDEAAQYMLSLSAVERAWLYSLGTWFEKNQLDEWKNFPRPESDRMTSIILRGIWLGYLAKTRCAWCWHAADIESMAQWHIYAKEGVAISSTPDRLIKAISKSESVSGAQLRQVEYLDFAKNEACPPSVAMKPYFVKQKCYAHEREVRMVCCADNGVLRPGVMLEVDWRELLLDIIISPLMPESESCAVIEALRKLIAPHALNICLSSAHMPFRVADDEYTKFTRLTDISMPDGIAPAIARKDLDQ